MERSVRVKLPGCWIKLLNLQAQMMDVDIQRMLAGMQVIICKWNFLPSTVKLVAQIIHILQVNFRVLYIKWLHDSMVHIFLDYLIDPQLVKTCKLSLPYSQMELIQTQLTTLHTLISYLSITAFMPCSSSGSLTFYNENLYIFYLSHV
jgi:hypothetical protein